MKPPLKLQYKLVIYVSLKTIRCNAVRFVTFKANGEFVTRLVKFSEGKKKRKLNNSAD